MMSEGKGKGKGIKFYALTLDVVFGVWHDE